MNSSLPKHLADTIVFTRHPQALHNIDHARTLREGITNFASPVTQAGTLQAAYTSIYLKNEFTFTSIFCSELVRTHKIPRLMGEERRMKIHSGLNERDMGVWHRMSKNEVEHHYPDEYDKYKNTRHQKVSRVWS